MILNNKCRKYNSAKIIKNEAFSLLIEFNYEYKQEDNT